MMKRAETLANSMVRGITRRDLLMTVETAGEHGIYSPYENYSIVALQSLHETGTDHWHDLILLSQNSASYTHIRTFEPHS